MADFSILTFSSSLRNLINKHNTTTSAHDISNGLKERIKSVTVGFHEGKAIPSTLYPVVYVEPRRREEDWQELGPTARRKMTLEFQIVAITDYGLGVYSGRETADQEMLRVSSNVEKLLRNYPKLSITSVMSSLVTGVEYDTKESNDTYNSIAQIGLMVEVFSS